MIDKICEYLTNKIRKQMPEVDDEKAEIINYGIQLIVGEIPKIFLMFGLGIILGLWWQTLLAFFFTFTIQNSFRWLSYENTYRMFFVYKPSILWKCLYKYYLELPK